MSQSERINHQLSCNDCELGEQAWAYLAVLTRRIKGCEFNPPYFTGIYVGIGTKRVLRRKRDTPRTEEN